MSLVIDGVQIANSISFVVNRGGQVVIRLHDEDDRVFAIAGLLGAAKMDAALHSLTVAVNRAKGIDHAAVVAGHA